MTIRTDGELYANDPKFNELVRDASVLLQAKNPVTDERLKNIGADVYYTVYIRIAGKKLVNGKTEGAFLYTKEEAALLMPKIGNTAEADNSRFASYVPGVASIIRRITAALLLRMIPLNSSLKFKETSDDLIKEAYEDLDRLLEVVSSSSSITLEEADQAEVKGQASVYLAYELNKALIPESAFNIADPDSTPPTYTTPVIVEKVVDTVNMFSIPNNHIGICRIQMTAQAYDADTDLITTRERTVSKSGSSLGVSIKFDEVLEVTNEDTIDTLISKISEKINNETLNLTYNQLPSTSTANYVTNILVAPEYQKPRLESTFTKKKLMYPESTINEKRIALFDTYYRTNRLNFEARRYSTKVDTELLVIGFYTVPENYKTVPPIPSGQTEKKPNEIVKLSTSIGIPGLIYGQGSNLADLQNSSPISLFLNVDKGNVAAVSIKDNATTTTTESSDETSTDSLANQIDTFYFAVEQTDPYISSSTKPLVFPAEDNILTLRISTSNYLNEPARTLNVDLSKITYTTNLGTDESGNLLPNYIGEDIANLVVEALYNEARTSNLDTSIQSTNILGAVVGDFENFIPRVVNGDYKPLSTGDTTDSNKKFDSNSGRVQIVAFRYREQEYKAVVDIIKIPSNLWIATGNYQRRRTLWEKGRRRSISIETKDLKTSAGSAATTMTDAEVLNSVNASVSQTEARKSALLQSVYDKRRMFDDLKSKGTTQGYYRRPESWLI